MLKQKATGGLYCSEHPKYKAVYKPRCLCEDCWYIWFYLHKTRII